MLVIIPATPFPTHPATLYSYVKRTSKSMNYREIKCKISGFELRSTTVDPSLYTIMYIYLNHILYTYIPVITWEPHILVWCFWPGEGFRVPPWAYRMVFLGQELVAQNHGRKISKAQIPWFSIHVCISRFHVTDVLFSLPRY